MGYGSLLSVLSLASTAFPPCPKTCRIQMLKSVAQDRLLTASGLLHLSSNYYEPGIAQGTRRQQGTESTQFLPLRAHATVDKGRKQGNEHVI